MNRQMRFVFTFIIFTLLVSPKAEAQRFSSKPTWAEEFRCKGTKSLENWYKWKGPYETGTLYFTDSIGNLYLKNGYLHLKATADKRGNRECSSAYVSTKGLKTFMYGKLEIKAKVPIGKGIFPAIWMLREDHGTVWPIGEIDLMEYIDCFKNKEFATTIHLTYRENGFKSDPIKYTHSKQKKTIINKFHIYGIEWTPEELTFTLDHKPYFTLTKKQAEYWPFDVPYILILSVGFGGWGGKCGMDYSILPREMLIDWVRYYPLFSEE